MRILQSLKFHKLITVPRKIDYSQNDRASKLSYYLWHTRISLGGDVRNQNLPYLVKCGQVAYNVELCPYLASGMLNKTPTGHLLPVPPANYEIFETSSKYTYLHTNRCGILLPQLKKSENIFEISIKFRIDWYAGIYILKMFQKFHN